MNFIDEILLSNILEKEIRLLWIQSNVWRALLANSCLVVSQETKSLQMYELKCRCERFKELNPVFIPNEANSFSELYTEYHVPPNWSKNLIS